MSADLPSTKEDSPLQSKSRKRLSLIIDGNTLSVTPQLTAIRRLAEPSQNNNEKESPRKLVHKSTDKYLSYGMIVSLYNDRLCGFMTAEGYASLGLRLEQIKKENGDTIVSGHFRNCLFEVMPEQSSAASTMWTKEMERKKKENRRLYRQAYQEYQARKVDEEKWNHVLYERLYKTPIKYGDRIQLRHIKSNRYICVDDSLVPGTEEEVLQVSLGVCSDRSHFEVNPKFKTRKIGMSIQCSDQILLLNQNKKKQFYLKACDPTSMVTTMPREIHASASGSTPWQTIFFDYFVKQPTVTKILRNDEISGKERSSIQDTGKNDTPLRAGACIRLLHLESMSWMSASQDNANITQNVISPRNSLVSTIIPLAQRNVTVFLDRAEIGRFQEGNKTKHNTTTTTMAATHTLWEIEKKSLVEGGEIHWNDIIRFRNVYTGAYLCLYYPTTNSQKEVQAENPIQTNEAGDFVFLPVSSIENPFPCHDIPVRIRHVRTGRYLHASVSQRLYQRKDKIRGFFRIHSENKLHPYVDYLTSDMDARDDDAFQIEIAETNEIDDTLLLLSFSTMLKTFTKYCEGYDASKGPFSLKALINIIRIISDLIYFCLGTDNLHSDALNAKGKPNKQRQYLFRYQSYFELLVRVIHACLKEFHGFVSLVDIRHATVIKARAKKEKNGNDDDEKQERDAMDVENEGITDSKEGEDVTSQTNMECISLVSRIIILINRLFIHMFAGLHENEEHFVETAFPTVLTLLGNGVGASETIYMLIKGNKPIIEILDQSLSIRIIELIEHNGRQPRYLHFLSLLCSVEGIGMSKMQEQICQLLFDTKDKKTHRALLPIRTNSTQNDFVVLACEEKDKWIDFRALNYDTVLPPSWKSEKYLYSYLVCQLELFSSMCLDRNYASIQYIRQIFPRDILYQSILNIKKGKKMMSALVEILCVLYIDCEPQKSMNLPRHIRCWNKISLDIPSCEKCLEQAPDQTFPGEVLFLTRVKGFVLSFLTDKGGELVLGNKIENELILAVCKLCHKLVDFGVYTAIEDLEKLVAALADLLDGYSDIRKCDVTAGMATHRRALNFDLQNEESPLERYDSKESIDALAIYEEQKVPDSPSVVHKNPEIKQIDVERGEKDLKLKLQKMSSSSKLETSRHNKNNFASTRRSTIATKKNNRINERRRSSILRDLTASAAKRASVLLGITSAEPQKEDHSESPRKRVDSERSSRNSSSRHSNATINEFLMKATDEFDYNLPRKQPTALDDVFCRSSVAFTCRYQYTEESSAIMKIKATICNIFLSINNLRIDYQISTILSNLKRTHVISPPKKQISMGLETIAGSSLDSKLVTPLEQIMNQKSLQCKYSLDVLAKKKLSPIFMHMLMYEYRPLVSSALELLLQQFNRHDSLVKVLNSVQILISDQSIAIYDELVNHIETLRKLAEATEIWMDLTSEEDRKNIYLACCTLQHLEEFILAKKSHLPFIKSTLSIEAGRQCNFSSLQKQTCIFSISKIDRTHCVLQCHCKDCSNENVTELSDEDSFVRNSEITKLLRNLRAPEYIYTLLTTGSHFYLDAFIQEDAKDATNGKGSTTVDSTLAERQQALEALFVSGFSCLLAYCKDKPTNQIFLSQYSLFILKFTGRIEEAQALLVGIYCSNEELLRDIPLDIIQGFVTNIMVCGRQTRFLLFLESIVNFETRPILRNQTYVLQQLLGSSCSVEILEFFDDSFSEVEELVACLQAEESIFSAAATSKPKEKDALAIESCITYHCRLLHLLAACASGNEEQENKIVCQQVLPLSKLLFLLHCNSPVSFRFAVLRFINEVYIDIEEVQTKRTTKSSDRNTSSLHEKTMTIEILDVYIAEVTRSTRSVMKLFLEAELNPSVVDDNIQHIALQVLRGLAILIRRRLDQFLEDIERKEIITAYFVRCIEHLYSVYLLTKPHVAGSCNLAAAIQTLCDDLSPYFRQIENYSGISLTEKFAALQVGALVESPISDFINLQRKGYNPDVLIEKLRNCEWITQSVIEKIPDVVDQSCAVSPKPLATHKSSPKRLLQKFHSNDESKKSTKESPLKALHLFSPMFGSFNASPTDASQAQVSISEPPFDSFLRRLESNNTIKAVMEEELCQMMHDLLHVEEIVKESLAGNTSSSPVYPTFRAVVSKLVSHVELSKDSRFTKMNLSILNAFCQMLHATRDGEKRHKMQSTLADLGVTRLLISMIAFTEEETVFSQCMELGIALLEGLNTQVQKSFYHQWTSSDESSFFLNIYRQIEKAYQDLKKTKHPIVSDMTSTIKKSTDESTEAAPDTSKLATTSSNIKARMVTKLFRFLQLCCEGHSHEIQLFLINQDPVKYQCSRNLLDACLTYLIELHNHLSSDNVSTLIQLYETITEFCQGPCHKAQETIANYRFFSAVNNLLIKNAVSSTCIPPTTMRSLLGAMVKTVLSLIEGHWDAQVRYCIMNEVNFDAVKENLVAVYRYYIKKYKDEESYRIRLECADDEYLITGFNVYILIQQLLDYDPQAARLLEPRNGYTEIANDELHPTSSEEYMKKNTVLLKTDPALYTKAYSFFRSNSCHVEVVWRMKDRVSEEDKNILLPIYFPIHPICRCLTSKTKEDLLWNVDRENNKLFDFFQRIEYVLSEMHYQSRLLQHKFIWNIAQYGALFKKLAFYVAIVMSGLLLFAYKFQKSYDTYPTFDPNVEGVMHILAFLQIGLCCSIIIFYLLNSSPLLIREGWRASFSSVELQSNDRSNDSSEADTNLETTLEKLSENGSFTILPAINSLSSLFLPGSFRSWLYSSPFAYYSYLCFWSSWFLLRSPLVYYYLFRVIIAILGMWYPVLYPLHLLDFLDQHQDLKNVSRAVTRPGKILILTVILYFILVFIYAVIGYTYYTEQFQAVQKDLCTSLFDCFLLIFDEGFKNNGGIGAFLDVASLPDTHSRRWRYGRFFYDNSYNVILMIVLLNIVFGLIVDTFAELRQQHKDKLTDMISNCFICSRDGYDFDLIMKNGFYYHRKYEHNLWHYIYLFAHLRYKEITDYTGAELYLATRIARNDISFFPTRRALMIEKHRPMTATKENEEEIQPGKEQNVKTEVLGNIVFEDNHEKNDDKDKLSTRLNEVKQLQDELRKQYESILAEQSKIKHLLERKLAKKKLAASPTKDKPSDMPSGDAEAKRSSPLKVLSSKSPESKLSKLVGDLTTKKKEIKIDGESITKKKPSTTGDHIPLEAERKTEESEKTPKITRENEHQKETEKPVIKNPSNDNSVTVETSPKKLVAKKLLKKTVKMVASVSSGKATADTKDMPPSPNKTADRPIPPPPPSSPPPDSKPTPLNEDRK